MAEITIVIKANVEDNFLESWRDEMLGNIINIAELVNYGKVGPVELTSIEIDGIKVKDND